MEFLVDRLVLALRERCLARRGHIWRAFLQLNGERRGAIDSAQLSRFMLQLNLPGDVDLMCALIRRANASAGGNACYPAKCNSETIDPDTFARLIDDHGGPASDCVADNSLFVADDGLANSNTDKLRSPNAVRAEHDWTCGDNWPTFSRQTENLPGGIF